MNIYEAKQVIRDVAMRRALLEFLQEATQEPRGSAPKLPEPMRDDEEVKSELKRILKGC
jgi:hypothetical protein